MQRAPTVVVVFVVLAGAALGTVLSQRSRQAPTEVRAADAGGEGRAADGGLGAIGDGGPDAARSGEPEPGTTETSKRNADAGITLLDGGLVPPLESAPKSVVFGVVVIRYQGAQGARAGTRSYAEARELAAELAELAQSDFEAAVSKGDPGSTGNAGRMFPDVLEPAPQYVLFSLAKGEVGGPVNTPTGFWVVKRLE